MQRMTAAVPRALAATALLLTAVFALGVPTRDVFACSGGGGLAETFANADLVVAGTFTGWDAPTGDGLVPVTAYMQVERTFKGQVRDTLTLVDPASLQVVGSKAHWVGASGACGAFDFDPTGHYAIMALHRTDDGTLRPNRLTTFYWDAWPAGPNRGDLLAQLDALARVGAPDAGNGLAPRAGAGRPVPLVPVALAGTVIAAIAGLVVAARHQRGNFPRR